MTQRSVYVKKLLQREAVDLQRLSCKNTTASTQKHESHLEASVPQPAQGASEPTCLRTVKKQNTVAVPMQSASNLVLSSLLLGSTLLLAPLYSPLIISTLVCSTLLYCILGYSRALLYSTPLYFSLLDILYSLYTLYSSPVYSTLYSILLLLFLLLL